MLVNGGTLDGVRLLSPKTIELMTASHTVDLPHAAAAARRRHGLRSRLPASSPISARRRRSARPGMYGWSGIYGTIFWVDPKEKLVVDHDGAALSRLDRGGVVPAARLSGAREVTILRRVK